MIDAHDHPVELEIISYSAHNLLRGVCHQKREQSYILTTVIEANDAIEGEGMR